MTAADVVVPELTTVADDEVVLFAGTRVSQYSGLSPGTDLELEGVAVRTLPRPPGARLATVATVNDVHFGETECGRIDSLPHVGPVLGSAHGEPPYPETTNRAAVAEISAARPDAVVVKGDLTTHGTLAEYRAFLDCYGSAFGDRLHHVRGNHDASGGETFAHLATQEVVLDGVVLAILDTVVPGKAGGQVTGAQLDWLDELAGRADRPVLVFGHHHAWDPGCGTRPAGFFGINPDDSERLVELVGRRRAIAGYFAGHTHRNRVRRFAATGEVPWVEVACVKDFPGAWVEYRVFEGGILQVFRRISEPRALAWTERTRAMFGGLYAGYAFGSLSDRCFPILPR